MRLVTFFVVASATALAYSFGQTPPQSSADEQLLQAAGLSSDGDALLQFFRDRTRTSGDFAELLRMAQQLGDASADKRAQAKAKLLGSGPWAIPALRHVVNDLENPLAAQQARHCLDWLEGKRATELPSAAARLLAARKPMEAAGMLLTFLPFAGDPIVGEGVKSALDTIAARPGKSDAALLAALTDPLPLRRAVAAEVLASTGRAELLPEVRRLLSDTKPQVRVRVALALTQHLEEKAVATLIDMLVEAPAAERRQAELALHHLAGAWSPTPLLNADDELSRKICHEAWSAWWRSVDGPALTAAFRLRSLNETEAVAAKSLVDQLGSSVFIKREQSAANLIAQGTKVIGLLREASKSKDPELAQRAEICLKAIAKNEARDRLPLTAPRLLAIRAPADASATLLAFLPFADDHAMSAAIVKTLSMLVRVEGKPGVALLKALRDPHPVRQNAAADALAGAGNVAYPAIRKLLTDVDPEVRLQAALALVHAHDKEAVATLIELIADLPFAKAKDADELLRRLAGAKAPARPLADDPTARKNLHAAWLDWWKGHAATIDLAALEQANVHAGLIVIAEVGPNNARAGGGGGFKGKGGLPAPNPPNIAKPAPIAGAPGNGTDRLLALDRDSKIRWQIEGLDYPMDFQFLAGGRILIAEYLGKRVTERDATGKILWEAANLPGAPTNVQRLANGNTFIAMYNSAKVGGLVMEVDRTGKTVTSIRIGQGPNDALALNEGLLIAAHKSTDGTLSCLFARGESCVRLDANGKEIGRFQIAGINHGVISREGNLDVTPKGHLLVMQNINTLTEFDANGKVVWQVSVPGHRAARLANGNTLVASETRGVVELDHAGKTLWQYQPPAGYQAIRARQGPMNVQASGK